MDLLNNFISVNFVKKKIIPLFILWRGKVYEYEFFVRYFFFNLQSIKNSQLNFLNLLNNNMPSLQLSSVFNNFIIFLITMSNFKLK